MVADKLLRVATMKILDRIDHLDTNTVSAADMLLEVEVDILSLELA